MGWFAFSVYPLLSSGKPYRLLLILAALANSASHYAPKVNAKHQTARGALYMSAHAFITKNKVYHTIGLMPAVIFARMTAHTSNHW
jgi:hypothetical protein